LAQGIDAAAHEGALEAGIVGAGTVAVMGTGIDRIYPAQHRELAHRIAAHGALVSELPLGTGALPHHFPRRNRLVAGLCQGVLVVEATKQSGSLITARLAAENGREVFAIPGSIHSPLSRGCHALIRQGAKLVETAQDITDELGGSLPSERPTATSLAIEDAVKQDEHPLLHALGHDPLPLEVLQARTGLETAVLQAQLLELELNGLLTHLEGGHFQRLP
jgi:DNA processing protein